MHVDDYSQLLWEEEGDKVLQIIYIFPLSRGLR